MVNERLRSSLDESEYNERSLAEEIGLDVDNSMRKAFKGGLRETLRLAEPLRNARRRYSEYRRIGFGQHWRRTVNRRQLLKS